MGTNLDSKYSRDELSTLTLLENNIDNAMKNLNQLTGNINIQRIYFNYFLF